MRLAVVGAAALTGAVLDVRAVRRRSYSAGWERQTPKALAHVGTAWWVTPLLWGLDTGLIWTTYRVSFCSCVLLVLVVLGAAPPWTGLVYGLAFAAPLVVAVLRPVTAVRRDCDVSGRRPTSPRIAQLIGVAALLMLSAGVLWAGRGFA
jgi:hypothetical protein